MSYQKILDALENTDPALRTELERQLKSDGRWIRSYSIAAESWKEKAQALEELLEEVLDSLPRSEPGGPCPVCWTYTHKSWCWYQRAQEMLGKDEL